MKSKLNLKLQFANAGLVAALTVAGAAPTVEARMTLNGEYAFTTARSCTVAISPFDIDASGNPTRIPETGVAFRQDAVDSGIITFNVDGTGTSVGRSKTMNISNTTVGASIVGISEFSGPITYTVNADNTVDVSFGVVTFTTILGGGIRNTGTVSPRTARLQIGNGGNAIVSAPATTIEQETLVITPPFGPTFMQYRLCTRSGLEVRM